MRDVLSRPAGATALGREPGAGSGLWIFLSGINGLMAVLASGYGYHGLADDPGAARMFEIAATFQLAHALALLALAIIGNTVLGWLAWLVAIAGGCFTLGIILFSWSLYAYVLLGTMPVPGAAPVGGGAMIVGWMTLAVLGGAVIIRGRQRAAGG